MTVNFVNPGVLRCMQKRAILVEMIYLWVMYQVIATVGFLIALRIWKQLLFVELFCVSQYHLTPDSVDYGKS